MTAVQLKLRLADGSNLLLGNGGFFLLAETYEVGTAAERYALEGASEEKHELEGTSERKYKLEGTSEEKYEL